MHPGTRWGAQDKGSWDGELRGSWDGAQHPIRPLGTVPVPCKADANRQSLPLPRSKVRSKREAGARPSLHFLHSRVGGCWAEAQGHLLGRRQLAGQLGPGEQPHVSHFHFSFLTAQHILCNQSPAGLVGRALLLAVPLCAPHTAPPTAVWREAAPGRAKRRCGQAGYTAIGLLPAGASCRTPLSTQTVAQACPAPRVFTRTCTHTPALPPTRAGFSLAWEVSDFHPRCRRPALPSLSVGAWGEPQAVGLFRFGFYSAL